MKRFLCIACLAAVVFWGLSQSEGEPEEDSLIPSTGGEMAIIAGPNTDTDFDARKAMGEDILRELEDAAPDTIICYNGETGEYTIIKRSPDTYDLTPVRPQIPDESNMASAPIQPHTVFDPDTRVEMTAPAVNYFP